MMEEDLSRWLAYRARMDAERQALEARAASWQDDPPNTEEMRERVDLLVELADRLRVSDPDRAPEALYRAREWARAGGYPDGLAYVLAELARLLIVSLHHEESARLCFEALELLKDQTGGRALANVRLQLGWMYDYLGDYSSAVDWGIKALQAASELGNHTLHARALDLVACVHSQMDDHAAAKQYHAESVRVSEQTCEYYHHATILNNQAMTQLYAGDLEQALATARFSLEMGRALGMRRHVSNFADTVGEILMAMGRHEEAETVLDEALQAAQSLPPQITLCYLLKNLGRVNMACGDLTMAEVYLTRAIQIMEQINARGELALTHQLMSELLERKGDPTGALEHFKTFYILREATAGKETARRLTALKTSYEIQIAQRDAEIQHLRNAALQAEIEERKRVQVVLERLATTDMLTGLYNRHHFFALAEREVERSMRYGGRLALLMVDLDHFKRVNDTLGHIAGDQVLMAIGESIRATLRDVDLAGRYGGEEIAILLPETGSENALRAAERLCAAIATLAVNTDAGRVSVTASVGVAGLELTPLAERTSAETAHAGRILAGLLDRADRALYRAKGAGRNTVRVSQ